MVSGPDRLCFGIIGTLRIGRLRAPRKTDRSDTGESDALRGSGQRIGCSVYAGENRSTRSVMMVSVLRPISRCAADSSLTV